MKHLFNLILIFLPLIFIKCGGSEEVDPKPAENELIKGSEVKTALIDGTITEKWVFKSRTVSKAGKSVTVTDCQSDVTEEQFTDVFDSDGILMNGYVRSYDWEFEPDGTQIDPQTVVFNERACVPQLARVGAGYDIEEIDSKSIMFKPGAGYTNWIIKNNDITDTEIKMTYVGTKLAYGQNWYEKYTIVYVFTRTKWD